MPLDAEEIAALRLERLGDELRSQGRLSEARDAFERLLSIAPLHLKAERLFSILSHRAPVLPSNPGGLKPAPFVLASQFLPPLMRDEIFEFLVSKAATFEVAQTNEGVRLELRRSLFRPNCFCDLAVDVRNAFEKKLVSHLQETSHRLLVHAFQPTFIEIHGLIYRNGDFFRAHSDTGTRNTRRITFILNLHSHPKRFEGGELLLYDTYFRSNSVDSDAPLFARTHTRLAPDDNRLILFPSEFYHEVIPVVVGDDLRHARFSVNGWFHTTQEEGDLDWIAQTPY